MKRTHEDLSRLAMNRNDISGPELMGRLAVLRGQLRPVFVQSQLRDA